MSRKDDELAQARRMIDRWERMTLGLARRETISARGRCADVIVQLDFLPLASGVDLIREIWIHGGRAERTAVSDFNVWIAAFDTLRATEPKTTEWRAYLAAHDALKAKRFR